MNLRINFAMASAVFGIVPHSRTSPSLPDPAIATEIRSLCTSRPTYALMVSMTVRPMFNLSPVAVADLDKATCD